MRLHDSDVVKMETLSKFLFTQIYENNVKRCIMHARPVVGDVTL